MDTQLTVTDSDGHATTVGAVILTETSKDEVIRRLATVASDLMRNAMSPEDIVDSALSREALATSVVAEDIAFPHALTAQAVGSVVVVGSAPTGIAWDPTHSAVRVVALFAGSESEHLRSIALMARLLGPEDIRSRIAELRSTDDILAAIRTQAGSPNLVRTPGTPQDAELQTREIGAAARRIAEALPAARLALIASTFAEDAALNDDGSWADWVRLEGPGDGSARLGDELTIGAVARDVGRAAIDGRFGDAQSVVVAWGEPGSDRLSMIRVVSLHAHLAGPVIPGFHPLVVERVTRLAHDISREGREGKPVGCFFVIADPDELAPITHQLIVNPFQGYPPEERNVLDPALEETIKEFSKIDGAFVIAADGTVVSAGTYVAVTPESLNHHPGHGARHASARAVTSVSRSVAVAVSESTGRVSVYFEGRRQD